MNEITERTQTPLMLIQSAITSGMSPEGLEKLMDLQERFEASSAKKAFNRALVKAQSEMPTIFKGRQGDKAMYASFDDIMRCVRPALDMNGLALSFSQSETATALTVVCTILHVDGHSSSIPFTLPKDGPLLTKDGRNITNMAQAQGAANSYARRYCLCNALNITVGDQDDDAKALSQPIARVTEEQAMELAALAAEAEVDEEKFLLHHKITCYAEMPLVLYAKALATLRKRISKNEGGAQ